MRCNAVAKLALPIARVVTSAGCVGPASQLDSPENQLAGQQHKEKLSSIPDQIETVTPAGPPMHVAGSGNWLNFVFFETMK